MSEGILAGASSIFSPLFGTAELIARKLSAGLSGGLVDSLQGDIEFKIAKSIAETLVGKEDILTASGSQEARRTRQLADQKIEAQLFFERVAASVSFEDIRAAEKKLLFATDALSKATEAREVAFQAQINKITKNSRFTQSEAGGVTGEQEQNAIKQGQTAAALAAHLSRQSSIIERISRLGSGDSEGVEVLSAELDQLSLSIANAEDQASKLRAEQEQLANIRSKLGSDPFAKGELLRGKLQDQNLALAAAGTEYEAADAKRQKKTFDLQRAKDTGDQAGVQLALEELRALEIEVDKRLKNLQTALASQDNAGQQLERFQEKVNLIRELAQDNIKNSDIDESVRLAEESVIRAESAVNQLKRSREAGAAIGSSFNTAAERISEIERKISSREAAINEIKAEGGRDRQEIARLTQVADSSAEPEEVRVKATDQIRSLAKIQRQRIEFIQSLDKEVSELRERIPEIRSEKLASPKALQAQSDFAKGRAIESLPGLAAAVKGLSRVERITVHAIRASEAKIKDAQKLIDQVSREVERHDPAS
ncbi:MAG: hypothetical protein HC771_16110 [Synechococcales cyanobacterium CRU_2_2]|nr:hypothetical protein [Synechococcales cyanobacterium CRU_2_2]